MDEHGLTPESKSWLDDWRIASAIFVVLVSLVTVIVLTNKPTPFVYPHIKAPPYKTGAGCEGVGYAQGGYFPSRCVDRNYRFRDAAMYGIQPATRAVQFYRVNNDLLDLSCGIYEQCQVHKVYKNVFFQ